MKLWPNYCNSKIGGKITQKLLRLFDVATVIGVLRLYFLELPGSLLNGDEYETVKIIYSSGRVDVSSNPNMTFFIWIKKRNSAS
jgi:hypothetical protein